MKHFSPKLNCCGTTTIGPKGQIVIPAKLRKNLKINTGDQLLVFQNEHPNSIVLVKAEDISTIIKSMTSHLSAINKTIKK